MLSNKFLAAGITAALSFASYGSAALAQTAEPVTNDPAMNSAAASPDSTTAPADSSSPAATTPAIAATPKIIAGAKVVDPKGAPVGTIEKVSGQQAVLATATNHRVTVPFTSFAAKGDALVIAMTAAEVDKAAGAAGG